MKKYNNPVIKIVQLDQKQTTLQVCMIGGGYFIGTTNCLAPSVATSLAICPSFVKGSGNLGMPSPSVQNAPS